MGEKTKVIVYLDRKVAQRLDQAARQSGIPRSELVERACDGFKHEVLEHGPVGAERQARYLRNRGLTIAAIAVVLNDKGYLTSFGKPWTYSTVQRMLARSGQQ